MDRGQFFNFIKKDNDTEEKMCRFTNHYMKYFDNYTVTGKKGGFNLCAFFGYGWLLYRRMYLNAFLLTIFMVILNFISAAIFVEDIENFKNNLNYIKYADQIYLILLSIIILFFYVRYSDYVYLKFAEKKISKGVPRLRPSALAVIFGPMILVAIVILIQVIIFIVIIIAAL